MLLKSSSFSFSHFTALLTGFILSLQRPELPECQISPAFIHFVLVAEVMLSAFAVRMM